MILTKKPTPEAGDLLVAQSPITYECLVFSDTGTTYPYDTDHSEFDGNGRYKPRNGSLPATLAELELELFTHHAAKGKAIAKAARNSRRGAPIEVQHRGQPKQFDADQISRENITGTIDSFAALQNAAVAAGWPDDGTIPWTLADDSEVAMTLTELQELRDALAVRVFDLHLEYKAKKAALEALITA